ncbi:MAG: ribosomal protein S18-alanine N-acetyltransferase [Clostridia bacterium]|nr:ribosomal protein S18-alanine N-acetyltransferase [Clostridia bacterium]
MDFIIREAGARDSDALSFIEKECIKNPWSREMMAEDIKKPYTHYLMAEAHGEAAGFVGASLIADTADITNVAVLPAFRRRGMGRALVSAMTERLSLAGASEVLLEVRRGSDAARELYRGAGFLEISVRRAYYRDPVEDAVIMRRELK